MEIFSWSSKLQEERCKSKSKVLRKSADQTLELVKEISSPCQQSPRWHHWSSIVELYVYSSPCGPLETYGSWNRKRADMWYLTSTTRKHLSLRQTSILPQIIFYRLKRDPALFPYNGYNISSADKKLCLDRGAILIQDYSSQRGNSGLKKLVRDFSDILVLL